MYLDPKKIMYCKDNIQHHFHFSYLLSHKFSTTFSNNFIDKVFFLILMKTVLSHLDPVGQSKKNRLFLRNDICCGLSH